MTLPSPTTNTDPTRVSDVLTALAAHERRVILHHLITTPGNTTSIETLVGIVTNNTPTDSPGNDPEKYRTSLIHTHLPVLKDIGVVEYTHPPDTIRYTGDTLTTDVVAALEETLTEQGQ